MSPGAFSLGGAFGLVHGQVTFLVLPAAAARAGVVAADLGPRTRRALRGVLHVEERKRLVGQCEAHLEVALVEVGLGDRLEPVRLEQALVIGEEGRQRGGAGRGDLQVPLHERSGSAVALAALDPRISVRIGHGPAVGRHLAPHPRWQVGSAFEVEREPVGAEIDGAAPRQMFRVLLRHSTEGLVACQRGEDQQPQALAQVPDDRDAGTLDPQRRDVHSQQLIVRRHPPGRDLVEDLGRPKQLGHGLGRDATLLEVALLIALTRDRFDHDLEERVELRRRGDGYGRGVAKRRPDLGREGGVGHPDPVGTTRQTRERSLHGGEQHAGDGTVRVLGGDRVLTHDEPVAGIHPDHEPRAVRLVSIRDEEGRREAASDPLAAAPLATPSAPGSPRGSPLRHQPATSRSMDTMSFSIAWMSASISWRGRGGTYS